MDLATLQKKMLGLIKYQTPAATDDHAYVRQMAESDWLDITRETADYWISMRLQLYCGLTVSLMGKLGRFKEAQREFIRTRTLSPYIHRLGVSFLEFAAGHEHPFIAAMARFELALIRAKKGEPGEFVIPWPVNPYQVLQAALGKGELPAIENGPGWRTIVSKDEPKHFRVEPCA